jgi:23S rRNA pseudouridine2605 synthase
MTEQLPKLGKVPVERALSKLGLASRTQTRNWIREGRLKVNGTVVVDLAMPVVPEKDKFTLDGKDLQAKEWQTIMLYKPKGYVTTKSDEKGRKTIYDLLPPELQHLHPVGRLDMHTTGLLLLTTDTQLSARLTDPQNAVERVYAVTVEGRISQEEIKKLLDGINEGGELLWAQKIQERKVSGKESHLTVTLTEGKNREVRRMFEAIGHEVTVLKRIAFGPLVLGELVPGKYRDVPQKEITGL